MWDRQQTTEGTQLEKGAEAVEKGWRVAGNGVFGQLKWSVWV